MLPISLGPSPLSSISPYPSLPLAPAPQALTLPLDKSTYVAGPATSTTLTFHGTPSLAPLVVPTSTKGRLFPISLGPSPLVTISPYPVLPLTPDPQHLTLLFSRRAHTCSPETVICVAFHCTPPAVPSTVPRSTNGRLFPISPGSSPLFKISPYPKLPFVLRPQHLTLSFCRMAQVHPLPALTCLTV